MSLEHQLVPYFADLLLDLDKGFQKKAPQAIPNFDDLCKDPAGTLARREVVIGPRRRYVMATIPGVLLAITFSCGFMITDLESRPLRDRPLHKQVVAYLQLCAPPVVAVPFIVFLLYIMRGGEMVLRPDGVVMRYRRRMVFCPWALFDAAGEAWDLNRIRQVVPVRPSAIDDVVQGDGGAVKVTGRPVRTKQFYFRSKREAVLADLYAVRLDDVVDLLLHLGQKLGASPPSP